MTIYVVMYIAHYGGATTIAPVKAFTDKEKAQRCADECEVEGKVGYEGSWRTVFPVELE